MRVPNSLEGPGTHQSSTQNPKSKGVTVNTIHLGDIITKLMTGSNTPEELNFIFTETVELPADTIVWLTAKKRELLAGRYGDVRWDMLDSREKRGVMVGLKVR